MSIHIGAKKGEIGPAVLMPGDPLRAKYIAETFLENPSCYNEVRGMYGFTGTYKGKKLSVQGSGMGQPSISIYLNELFGEYGVQTVIRVGSCGSMQPELGLRDIILAQTASTDSQINRLIFKGRDFAPCADFGLLREAWEIAREKGFSAAVGSVVTSDAFYHDHQDATRLWMDYNILAVEMETSALYTLAAKFRRKALAILTVSDSLVTKQETTAEEREKTFNGMIEIALETAWRQVVSRPDQG